MVQDGQCKGEPFKLTCLASVEPVELEWLWFNRFPLGKLCIIAGNGGLGKSLITLKMAADISTGEPWPDRPGIRQPVGDVVLLSSEDDLQDTIAPRLIVAGADLNRIHCLESLQSIDRDLEQLTQAIDSVENCRLVVIDPASAFMGRADCHKDADVRRVLSPIIKLAADKHITVVLIVHLNKREDADALYRAVGSIAFVAAARAVWMVSEDPANSNRRLMAMAKTNLSPDKTALAYTIQDVQGKPKLVWERNPVTITANEALRKRGPSASTRNKVADWLRGMLASGPKTAREVVEHAKASGYSERTVYRALEGIGATSERGPDGGAVWSITLPSEAEPLPSDPAPKEPDKLGKLGTTREKPLKNVNDNLGILGKQTPDLGGSARFATIAKLSEGRPDLTTVMGHSMNGQLQETAHDAP